MNGIVRVVIGALIVCLALPAIARIAGQLTGYLLSILIFFGIASLFWPSGRKRR